MCESIKKLYILTGCWTFDDDYAWPDSELFIRVETCVSSADEKLWTSTANPPVMFLTKSFKRSLPRLILGKILPQKYKEYFKIIIKRLSK